MNNIFNKIINRTKKKTPLEFLKEINQENRKYRKK